MSSHHPPNQDDQDKRENWVEQGVWHAPQGRGAKIVAWLLLAMIAIVVVGMVFVMALGL